MNWLRSFVQIYVSKSIIRKIEPWQKIAYIKYYRNN